MQALLSIGTDVAFAAQALRQSELVAIPTETVYGLAGNAFDLDAVTKIFRVKNRPVFDPLIIHTDSLDKVKHLTTHLPETALVLARRFWPGPLTLLLPKHPRVPDLVTAGSPLVAVRIPNKPVTLELLAQLDFPLAAPSANPFGYISPTTALHVAKQLGHKIPYILDGGACAVGVESTIVGFPPEGATIYRQGGLAQETIEEVAGKLLTTAHSTSSPLAPGMLKSHYAPGAPLYLGKINDLLKHFNPENVGIMSFKTVYNQVPEEQQIILSPSGDVDEAARNLFGAMRTLDELKLEAILAEPLPNVGLGRAVNDRLLRASVRN